jgi:iron complex transport system substrate-binding protein
MKRTTTILTILLAVLMLLAACSPSQPEKSAAPTQEAPQQSEAAEPTPSAEATEPDEEEPSVRTVTDVLSRTVDVPEKVEKVISLAPSCTEILFALGEGDKVIGVDSFSNYPAETEAIDKVGDFSGPNLEAIVEKAPDVVFAGNGLQEDAITSLENLGIAVVAAEARAFEGIEDSIRLMAEVMNASTVQDVIDEMNDGIAQAEAVGAALAEKPSVYYAMSYGEMGNWTSGPGSFINTLIEKAGGVCVTADAPVEWLEYNLEQLALDDPDIILVSSDMGSDADLSTATGYENLSAVKNGKVYVISADIASRPGPRIAEAMMEFAQIFAQAGE